jgi:hypothetical protein
VAVVDTMPTQAEAVLRQYAAADLNLVVVADLRVAVAIKAAVAAMMAVMVAMTAVVVDTGKLA